MVRYLFYTIITSHLVFAQTVKYIPRHEELKYTFGGHAPVMSIKPGTTVETWTEDCYDGSVKKPSDMPTKVAPIGKDNPQTGPFYIEGAQPGDVLAVHIVEISPAREYAISSNYPGFGALTGTEYTAVLNLPLQEKLWWYNVNNSTRTASTMLGHYKLEIPIEPFLGCIATAPQRGEVRWTVTPEAYGGNMDVPQVKRGATIYLPVNVEGALLELGDGHLAQGEGEIIGTALESALRVTFRVDLIKGKQVSWPRIENDEYIMTIGCYRPLEDAFRIAYKEMVLWLVDEFTMDTLDCYQLCSQVGETDVAQVVDPNYTVVAKIKKKYLPAKKVMEGMHDRMNTR
ncbi:MAG: acetamidase/formamidase family protein [Ignavibacteria bacterium]|nr:acetamidase/formamidase family protein [Ignavibacteria bacterium]MBI3766577.1 acetamidase/formamidase family protein [Ignavibacteriales bacterium]